MADRASLQALDVDQGLYDETDKALRVNVVAGGTGGGPATIANGADVAEGSTTDAAVSSDTTGTVSGKLRGLVKILADVWDSASHFLKVSIQNATLAVTQSGAWTTGRTWVLGSATDSITTVPSGTQTVSGSVTVSNFPATQPVSGTVSLTAGQPVELLDSGGTNKASISAAGAVKVDGSAATQPVSGTVTANAGTGTLSVDASGHTVPVSVADGSDVTQGAKADVAWGGSGSGSVVAILKAVYGAVVAAVTSVSAADTSLVVTPTVGNVTAKVSQTSKAVTLTNPNIVTGLVDANGNPWIAETATASAVDGITVTNAAAGNPATVQIAATGSDSNINLNLVSKNTGAVQINGTSVQASILYFLSGSAAGDYSHSGDTNFTDVDTTNLKKSITIPVGMRALITAIAEMYQSTAANTIALGIADGGTLKNETTANPYTTPAVSTPVVVQYSINGDGAAHIISMQFKTYAVADAVNISNTATRFPTLSILLVQSV